MEKFEVTVLGCGSALPTVRHNGSAQVVNVREKLFLVDCAEGTQLELRRNHIHLGRLFCVFITHLHGDHCFGLMGLISTLGLLGRTSPLHLYGPVEMERVYAPQLAFFCKELDFEVVFHPVDTTQCQVIYEDRSLTVTSVPLQHRIACCGYLFREKQGLRHVRPDALVRYEVPREQINNIKAGQDFECGDGTIVPNDQLTLPPNPPRSFAYISDTRFCPRIVPWIEGVNLLYHEATFAEADSRLCARVCHSTARQAATIASNSHAGKLMIGHFSSRYTDESILLREAQEVFPNAILAHEGLTVPVE